VSDPSTAGAARDPSTAGPLDRATAIRIIDHADALVASGDFKMAGAFYSRVVGSQDPDLHVAALIGLGECHYREDNEAAAMQAWVAATQAPETPLTWVAWKQVAAARVRHDDLRGALAAYQEADRRAPPEARAEIASRLGWLSKETGNERAAGRYFGRARVLSPSMPWMTYSILAITTAVSLLAMSGTSDGNLLLNALMLDKSAVAQGEYYRLLSVVLVHGGLLHLLFNMYALWIVGPVVERMYGHWQMLGVYVVCGIGASIASFVFVAEPSVGASGAIFGLFGILFVGLRMQRSLLDPRMRAVESQVAILIVINLVFGFGANIAGGPEGQIDNFAHIGGLLTGAWLGVLLAPSGVSSLSTRWRIPGSDGRPANAGSTALRLAGIALMLVVFAVGLQIGTQQRAAAGLHSVDGSAAKVVTTAAHG
jgi:rhomboid protease GluP